GTTADRVGAADDGGFGVGGMRRCELKAKEIKQPVRLLSIEEVADLLQIPVTTLYKWRFRREGPTPLRVGRFLRYDPGDVVSWVEERKAASR
ncbi:MAG: helix-turn-helix transcriptional regulator, partial [Actinomycetota bacterium]